MANELDQIKRLREKTSAGMMDCKRALLEADGDMDKAIDVLRKKGIALAAKRASRSANQGIVTSYIHMNNKIGVLLEVNCETDFVAKNDMFQKFVKDISMQVAASAPTYLKTEDVPEEVVEKEKEIIKEQYKNKPEQAMEKIVEGGIKKFYAESCLLQQPFIKDPSVVIQDLLTDTIAKTGENIIIRRFTRYQLGEEI